LAATVSVGVQDAGAAATAMTCRWAPTAPAVRRARRAALACSAPVALTKRKLIHWLLTHDFEELPRRATSHRRFRGPGTTITVPAHGRPELSAKHTGMLIRELEKAGFDRDQIREELGL
jgi:predicted RNA binding protein YcfA (HicA-like mRNA interferase family)